MSISEEEKRIKFPASHYVGFRQDTHALTGFLTPEGTDSAAKKRKQTVDDWVDQGLRHSVYNKETSRWESTTKDLARSQEVVENVPMSGFELGNRLNRGGSWHGNQDKWKVNDPRGFQLEISGANLQKILEISCVDKNVIQGECIWARLGADNILVPVNSDLYRSTQANTERYLKEVSINDVDIGDYVIFQNGEEGNYLGAYYVVYKEYVNYAITPILTSKKRHLFVREDQYVCISSPKVSGIDCSKKIIDVPTESDINKIFVNDSNKNIRCHMISGIAITSINQIPQRIIKHDVIARLDDVFKSGYSYVYFPYNYKGVYPGAKFMGMSTYRSPYYTENYNNRRSYNLYDDQLNPILEQTRYYNKHMPVSATMSSVPIGAFSVLETEIQTSYGKEVIKL